MKLIKISLSIFCILILSISILFGLVLINKNKNSIFKEIYMPKISEKKWDPSQYNEGSKMQLNTAIELLQSIDFSSAGSLLDIGCGDGKITSLIAEKNSHLKVIGLDISADMIKYAKSTYSKLSNLNFVVGDAHQINYKNKFDFIVSFWALSWIIDHGALINSVYQALNPGGDLFLLIPENNQYLFEATKYMENLPQWSEYFKNVFFHYNHANFELYRELINYYNLDKLYLKKKRISYKFSFDEEMILYIKGWLPHLEYIPKDKHLIFMQQLLMHYKKNMLNNKQDPNIIFYDCVLVHGNKV